MQAWTSASRRGLIRFSIALARRDSALRLAQSLRRLDAGGDAGQNFVAVALLCGIAYFAAVGSFPGSVSPKVQRRLFWIVVIVLRLVVLPLEPGDDFWRYQWEGKIQHAGFNPYVNAPDDPQLEAVRADFPNWYKINHRDFRAIYPPGAELLFAGLSRVSDSPLLYKLLFAGADIATIAVLLRSSLRAARARLYASAAWYAWNPLVVYSFAGSAHFDSLMLLPMVAGILLLTRFETRNGLAPEMVAGPSGVRRRSESPSRSSSFLCSCSSAAFSRSATGRSRWP